MNLFSGSEWHTVSGFLEQHVQGTWAEPGGGKEPVTLSCQSNALEREHHDKPNYLVLHFLKKILEAELKDSPVVSMASQPASPQLQSLRLAAVSRSSGRRWPV